MANPKIEVEVSSNIDQLKKGFSDSEAQVVAFGNKIDALKKKFDSSNGSIDNLKNRLSQLKKNLEGATDIRSIAKYNIRIRDTEDELDRLSSVGLRVGNSLKTIPNSLAKTTVGVNQLQRATSGYNGVGIEFSRIIQDAPFGILGVGNNITRLAETFTQARNSGQSFTQILGGVLKGGNALVLGISLLTTVFTVLSQKGFFKSKEAAEDAEEALNKYRESLDDLRKSALQGEITAQKEIQNFELLKKQAENANIPLNKRIEAVRDLQKAFPDYLGNLTEEQIKTGNVGDAYDRLTKSLLETAKARAASNIIIKNTEEVLTLQQQQIDNEQAIIDARDKVARLESNAANSAVNALRINGQITAQNTDLVDAKEKLNKLLEPQIERGNRINELTTTNLQLNNEINTSLEKGGTLTTSTLDKVEKLKRVYEDIASLPTTNPLERVDQQQTKFEAPLSLSSGKASTQGIFSNDLANKTIELKALEEQLQGTGLSVSQFYAAIGTGAAEGFNSLDGFVTKLSETQLLLNDTFKSLESGLENTIGDVAFAIGEAFANGGNALQAGGAALLGGIASVLNQLGQLAIGTGVAIKGIKIALESLNPAVAIGAGVALIALAGFVSSKAKSLGGSRGSSGGGGGGGGSVGAGVGSQAYTGSGLERSMNFEFVPLKIQGSDIYYSLEQQSKKRNQS